MLDRLNTPQREAVEHGEGPLLILAGAGSGKTRVITSRIAHLIAERDVAPEEIVAVTFTNKAADEMQERVGEILARGGRESDADRTTVSTFHSLGARLLRWHGSLVGLDRNFTILDQDDQLAFVREVAERMGLEIDHGERKRLRRYVERMKNRGHDPAAAREQTRDRREERDAAFYEAYQRHLRDSNAADFGDLLLGPLEIFRGDDDLVDSYSRQWRYVMVDEFQDTNPAQYELLRLLTRQRRNLAVVGDDDQSIYRWRDATVANILDFEEDYPDAHVVKLEQNYRSTERILEAANDVIQENPNRRHKRLWTDRGVGEPLTVFTAEDGSEEAEYVADEIQRLRRGGASYEDFAVFYRTNAQGRRFEEQMRAAGVPYRVVGGVSFYGREEIKDVLAYLQLALNPADDVSFLRVVGKPRRGVGEKTVEKLRHAAEVAGVESLFDAARLAADRTGRVAVGLGRVEPEPHSPADYEALDTVESLGGRPAGGLADFVDLIVDLRDGLAEERSLADLVRQLVDRVHYFDWLADRDPERAEDKRRNVIELMEAMEEFERDVEAPAPEPPVESGSSELGRGEDLAADSDVGHLLSRFLERSSLVRDAGSDESAGVVTLMTIHGAKGLEFDTVFLVGMEEELFPNLREEDDPEELYEERRLAYVAITRAERKLYMTNARRRRIYGRTRRTRPSRYLLDIDGERLEVDGRSCTDSIEYAPERPSWRSSASTGGADLDYGEGGDDWYFDQSAERRFSELRSSLAEIAEGDPLSQVPPEPERGRGEGAGRVGRKSDHEIVGKTVTHSRFGVGEVLAVSDEGENARLTIHFPGDGEQTVLRKFVRVMG